MARYKRADNPYREETINGNRCVIFQTVGKEKHDVIVDKKTWYGYLKDYSWTAIKSGKRIDVKTSINKQSNRLWRIIVEHEYDELDYWGTTIDHINNNPLDNRICNLRIFSTAILNSTNISSKYENVGMKYIYRQGSTEKPNGYKVHYNLAGRTYYKNFSVSDYGSIENTIIAAQKYRDEIVTVEREQIIEEMLQKTRNVEFERGLRDKLNAGEKDQVLEILKKYEII